MAKRQSMETLSPDVVFNKLQSNNHKYVQRIKGKSMKKCIGNLDRYMKVLKMQKENSRAEKYNKTY